MDSRKRLRHFLLQFSLSEKIYYSLAVMAAKASTEQRMVGSVVVRVLEDICDVDPTSISRSIFVTGFKTTIKSEDLIIHFQRRRNGGGDIESVTISKRGTALITFDSPDGERGFLAYVSVLLAGGAICSKT